MISAIHQSMIGMWLRCGIQFERRYINGEIIPPGISARRGSAVHKSAEINNRQKKQTRKDLPIGDLKDVARDEFMRLVRDEGVFLPKEDIPSKDKLLNEGLNESLSAVDVYHRAIAPRIMPVETELPITDDFGFTLPLSGTIDVVDETKMIRDLKVAKRKPAEWAARTLQPTFYALLYGRKTGVWPTGFIYDFVIPNKTMLYEALPTTRGENDVKILSRYIKSFEADLKTGTFKPADPDNWICGPEYCGFFQTCPYGGKT
jgi:hypothetical protein